MKEAIVEKGPSATVQDGPIPQISDPRQLIIRVIVSGCNPKDWKTPEWTNMTMNTGDDIAGVVHAVGDDVTEFKVGDRVASFHEMRTPGGSYAEYAIGWEWSTFHLAKNTSYEEAATIPLAAMTSAIGLYLRLRLPLPWLPAREPLPVIIYGAATAVGAFAIQLANLSNIHPLICVAGNGASFVETLIDRSKGDTIVDYRGGDDATVEGLKKALNGKTVAHAFDAVSEKGSYVNISQVLDQQKGNMTLVLPRKKYEEIPATIERSLTSVGATHETLEQSENGKLGLLTNTREFAFAFFRLFGRGMRDGWFKAHPYEVVPGGLNGVDTALKNLKEGKASAVKYVFRIADTPGVKSSL